MFLLEGKFVNAEFKAHLLFWVSFENSAKPTGFYIILIIEL